MTKHVVGKQTLAIAAVAAFALTLGAGSTAAMASVGGNPVAMSTVLASDQTPEDRLPSEDGQPFADGMGLVNETSRSLGGTETTNYWIVLDADANVCLVGKFTSDGFSTITCTTPENFQKGGISSLQYSETGYAEAYLAPDGLQAREIPVGLEQLDSGLISGDSRAAAEDALTFDSGDGARGRIAEITEVQLLHLG
ncbi:hypothetical protein [Microbacterium phyllosphaerae]|uniref:hypothetical protein n=1 Tax=Microbacterium phyllosphaerae TaxID=124798 RepID=UPI0011AE915A|nr:hypothetical protein [Microbacterium phyllosphaerae]